MSLAEIREARRENSACLGAAVGAAIMTARGPAKLLRKEARVELRL